MMQWIAKFIGRFRRPADTSRNLPCVYSTTDGATRVDVLEVQLPCGHCGYIVVVEYFVEEYGQWIEVACLRDFNVDGAIAQLQKAAWFITSLDHGLEHGPRQLPVLVLWGKRFFVDERLKELRNVEDPTDRFELNRGAIHVPDWAKGL